MGRPRWEEMCGRTERSKRKGRIDNIYYVKKESIFNKSKKDYLITEINFTLLPTSFQSVCMWHGLRNILESFLKKLLCFSFINFKSSDFKYLTIKIIYTTYVLKYAIYNYNYIYTITIYNDYYNPITCNMLDFHNLFISKCKFMPYFKCVLISPPSNSGNWKP